MRHPFVDPLEPRLTLSVAPAPVVLGPNTTPITATSDPQGNVVVVGAYSGVVDFNTHRNRTFALNSATDGSLYVAKYSPAGDLFWAKPYNHPSDVLSGTGPQVAGIATDANGNIVLVGRLNGAYDFDPGHRRRVLDNGGGGGDGSDRDTFVWKLNADGSFGYATLIQPPGIDAVSNDLKIAVSPDGSAYVAGNVDAVGGNISGSINFLSKVSADGRVAWTTQLERYSFPADIAFDRRQEPVVLTQDGFRGIAVNYVTSSGSVARRVRLVVSTNSSPVAKAMAFDAHGDLLISGSLAGLTDFNPDPAVAFVRDRGPNDTDFIAEYSPELRPVFVHLLAATVQDVAVDPTTGDAVVAGSFNQAVDFDPSAHGSTVLDTGDTYSLPGGQTDLFEARYATGGRFVSAKQLGVAKAFDSFIGLGVTRDSRPVVVAATAHTRAPRDRYTSVFRV